MILTIDEVNDLLDEMAEEFPAVLFDELNGGVNLLEEAVLSIVDAKEDSDLDSLFRAGGTTALLNQISGLDDFELICFLVVKEG